MARSRAESMRDLEHEIGVVIRRIRRVMVERAQEVHPDLNAVSYSVLTNLADFGPKRATEIAEVFSIDKGAVSRQVQQLVDLGLVSRSPDPADGRAAILAVTVLGQDRLETVMSARRRRYDAKLAEWSAADLGQFVSTLHRYNEAIEESPGRATDPVP